MYLYFSRFRPPNRDVFSFLISLVFRSDMVICVCNLSGNNDHVYYESQDVGCEINVFIACSEEPKVEFDVTNALGQD